MGTKAQKADCQETWFEVSGWVSAFAISINKRPWVVFGRGEGLQGYLVFEILLHGIEQTESGWLTQRNRCGSCLQGFRTGPNQRQTYNEKHS